jgi:rfaE bifunctional protein kinase chain/domain
MFAPDRTEKTSADVAQSAYNGTRAGIERRGAQAVNNMDPKDDPKNVPEKEQKPSTQPESNPNLSLGDIMPLNRDALQQLNTAKGAQPDNLITFGKDNFGGTNSIMGRGLTSELKRDLNLDAQNAQVSREFRFTGGTVNADIGSFMPMGNRQYFKLVKAEEFKPDEKPINDVKNLTNKFLTETKSADDEKLTPAEKQDLSTSRDQLAQATDPSDVLSNALHLARIYQHLRYIEDARKATELALGIDPDNQLGRQLFKELERMHPVDVGITSQAMTEAALTKSALRRRIQALTGGRVIVVGDLLIDELMEGRPERISREAPVLILEHVDTELIPGGAANTAHNIAALGGACHAVGICGDDEYANKLATLLEDHGITHSLVRDPSRPTTVKTRILSKSHSNMQQLLRLDRISHDLVSEEVENRVIEKLRQSAVGYRAIVLSDYKAGVITDGVIAACRQVASNHNLMVIVDAQQRFERFKGVTLMTPNQPDTEKAVGYKLDSEEALIKAGNDILNATGARALLVTRGGDGMALFEQNQNMVTLPAFNRSEVFDVTGAGDTVVGTMALTLVTGGTFLEAMALGNLAAGIVVRKSGTAVTSQKEMLDNLEALHLPE